MEEEGGKMRYIRGARKSIGEVHQNGRVKRMERTRTSRPRKLSNGYVYSPEKKMIVKETK